MDIRRFIGAENELGGFRYDPDLEKFSTDELLKLRALLVKYNPDQARVPSGSPDGGEFANADAGTSMEGTLAGARFSAAVRARGPNMRLAVGGDWLRAGGMLMDDYVILSRSSTPAERAAEHLHRTAGWWADTDASDVVRSVLAGTPVDPNVTGNFYYSPEGIKSATEMGQVLVGAVQASPPVNYPLYRGLAMNDADYASLTSTMTPGASVNLNLSSWTAAQGVANDFADNVYKTGYGSNRAVLEIQNGAKAYDATYDIPQGPQYREHLTDGTYTVVSSGKDASGRDLVVLRQERTLPISGLLGSKSVNDFDWLERYMGHRMAPPNSKKYSPDQPRDDHGRWADEGGAEYSLMSQFNPQPGPTREAEQARIPADFAKLSNQEVLDHVAQKTGLTMDPRLTKIPKEPLQQAMYQIMQMHAMFPNTHLTNVGIMDRAEMAKLNAPPGATAATAPDGTWIKLVEPTWTLDNGNLLYGVDHGWHPDGVTTPAGTVTHEFGHAYFRSEVTRDATGLMTWVLDHVTELGSVSGYALTALIQDKNPHEPLAEAFSAAYTPTSKEKDIPIALALRKYTGKADQPDIFKYNPEQLRVPAGSGEESGRWTDEGGSVAGAAASLYSRAARAEPRLTTTLQRIAGATGGNLDTHFTVNGKDMHTLGASVKSQASIARKLRDDMSQKGLTLEQAKAGIFDGNRYTLTYGHATYADRAHAAMEQLRAAGWQPYRGRDYWSHENGYAGINTNWISPDGQMVELQFHTPATLQFKEDAHILYEAARSLPLGSAERIAADQAIVEHWAAIRADTPQLDHITSYVARAFRLH